MRPFRIHVLNRYTRTQQLQRRNKSVYALRLVKDGKVKFDYNLKPGKFGVLSLAYPPYYFRQRKATNAMNKVPLDHAASIGS